MELVLILNSVAFLVAAVGWSRVGATNFLIKIVMAGLCLGNVVLALHVMGYIIKTGG
jgi:hypothetical protein